MKILHVNGGLSGGGAEQYLYQVIEGLNQKGHVNLLLLSEKGEQKIALSGTKAFYIDGITRFHCENLRPKLKQVQAILEQEAPDIIYIHQVVNSALIDLLTKRIPSVRFVHDFKLICPDGSKMLKSKGEICPFPMGYSCQSHAYRYRCMPRNILSGLSLIHHSKKIAQIHRQRSHMVVASEFMKSVLIYNGFQESKVKVIPYFTNLPELGIRPHSINKSTILCLGRLVREKGMHHLLRAFAKISKRARLIIVGDGPALNQLKTLAKDLGISFRVSFPGWLTHDKLDKLYHQCSLVVVPSIWPEPFGIVGIEAMAYQKPVIAFDMGGISEWLKEGETGFLVNPGDEAGLVQKINLTIEKPVLARQMGEKGKEIIKERFSPEVHLQRLITLFYEAIDSYPKSR